MKKRSKKQPTESELFDFYLKAGIDDIMPFESRYGSESGKEWCLKNWSRRKECLEAQK